MIRVGSTVRVGRLIGVVELLLWGDRAVVSFPGDLEAIYSLARLVLALAALAALS